MRRVPHSRGLTRASSGSTPQGTRTEHQPFVSSFAGPLATSQQAGRLLLAPFTTFLILPHRHAHMKFLKISESLHTSRCSGNSIPSCLLTPGKPSHSILLISSDYGDDLNLHLLTMKELHIPYWVENLPRAFLVGLNSHTIMCILGEYRCVEVCMKGYLKC